MDMNAVKYSDAAKKLATEIFAKLRLVIKLPENAIKGERFNGDFRLQWILESQTKEDQFMKAPYEACEAALIEAAKSDHWYKFEKDWGNDEPVYEDEVGEDCEVIEGEE